MAIRVHDPQELQNAIDFGERDILIASHIDFSGRDDDPVQQSLPGALPQLLKTSRSTRRIRGDCPDNLPDALAASLPPDFDARRPTGACVIYVAASFLSIHSESVWLDGLVIVHAPSEGLSVQLSKIVSLQRGSLFMTNSHVIGIVGEDVREQQLMRAFVVEPSATEAYFQNVTVVNVTSGISPISTAAPTAFHDCTLRGRPVVDSIRPSPLTRRGIAPGVVLVHDSAVLLRGTTLDPQFSWNDVVLRGAARVFTDAPVSVVTGAFEERQSQDATAAGADLTSISASAAFAALQVAPWDFAAGAPAAAAELAAPALRPAGGGGGENLNLAVILALAIVAGLALLALAVLCWRQRRPQSSAMPQELFGTTGTRSNRSYRHKPHPDAITGLSSAMPDEVTSSRHSWTVGAADAASERPAPGQMVDNQRCDDLVLDFGAGDSTPIFASAARHASAGRAVPNRRVTDDAAGSAGGSEPRPLPQGSLSQRCTTSVTPDHAASTALAAAAAAPVVAERPRPRRPVDAVYEELLQFPTDCETGLHGYVFQGKTHDNIRRGGQGVVVFVPQAIKSLEFEGFRAIKIFSTFEAFRQERALYDNTAINGFMPTVMELGFHENGKAIRQVLKPDSGAGPDVQQQEEDLLLRPDSGCYAVLARPYIVMEVGETLSDCVNARDVERNPFAVIKMLQEVAECLSELHKSQYVHRDVKPDNLLRVTRSDGTAWKIIDSGLARRIGSDARPAYTLVFAAPEAVAASAAGGKMAVTAALDSWALGVTAYTVLSEHTNMFPDNLRPFRDASDAEKIRMLGPEGCLPWEEPSASTAQHGTDSGIRELVLALLERDPAKRLSVEQFYSAPKLGLRAGSTQT